MTDWGDVRRADIGVRYGQAGSADDVLGRVATIGDGSTTYTAHCYLGAGTIIGEELGDGTTRGRKSFVDGGGGFW